MQDTAPIPTNLSSTGVDPIAQIAAARSLTGVIRFADDRTDSVSLDDLWRDAGLVQAALSNLMGTGAAPTVAVVLRATRACVTALLGAWRLGASVVSLPLPTRWTTPDEYGSQITSICELAGVTTVLADRTVCELLPPLMVPVLAVDDVVRRSTVSERVPEAVAGGRLIQFSSGTTGSPKGVVLPLTAVGANIDGILRRLDLGASVSTVSWLPLAHDMGLIGMLMSTLVAMSTMELDRGELTLLHPEEFLADPWSWLRALHDARGTVTAAPAFALARIARVSPRESLDLSRLTTLICGGEPISGETLRSFDTAVRVHGCPPSAVAPAYGMAETTLAVSIEDTDRRWSSSGYDGAELVNCGRPLDGMEVRVDPADARLGDGPRTLQVRGPSLMAGYLGATSPIDDDGWLTTSDLGVVDAAGVRVVGRVDDVLVLRGRNLSAVDIEGTVRSVTGGSPVRPGGIAAVTDGAGGLVVLLEAQSANPTESGRSAGMDQVLVATRREIVRRHGVRPAAVVPVPRGTLPRTTSGKLQRVRLSRLVRDGLLPPGLIDTGEENPPPRSRTPRRR